MYSTFPIGLPPLLSTTFHVKDKHAVHGYMVTTPPFFISIVEESENEATHASAECMTPVQTDQWH